METETSKTMKITTTKEMRMRKLLNIIGIFIFTGLVLSTVTNPIHSYEMKEFFLFVLGSSIVYYFLVNIHVVSKKVFFATLLSIGFLSISMVIYLLM